LSNKVNGMDPGQPIPVVESEPIAQDKKKLPEPESHVIKIPEATIAPDTEPQVAQIATIKLDAPLSTPTAIHAFKSGVKMVQNTITYDPHFTIEYQNNIDTSTERDFRLSMLEYEIKRIQESEFYIGPIKNIEEPLYKRGNITAPDSIGFDPYTAINALIKHENRSRIARTFLKDVRDQTVDPHDPLRKRYRKLATVLLTKPELQWYKSCDAITRERFRHPKVLHSFMKHFRDMQNRIQELGIIDPQVQVFYAPAEGSQRALTSFIKSNFRMSSLQTDLIRMIVQTRVPLKVEASQQTLREMVQVLSANNNQHRQVNDYPATLNARDARTFLEELLTCMMSNRFSRLGISLSMSDVSIGSLLACLLMKLLVPLDCMAEGFAIDVDNYIARHFIPSLPNYKRGLVNFDLQLAETRQVNYLEQMAAAGVLGAAPQVGAQQNRNEPRANFNAIWSFLRTTPNGDGWANAGLSEVVPLPADAIGLLNRDDIWYHAPFGKVPARRDEIPAQFNRFMLFVESVHAIAGKDGNRINVSSPHDRMGPSLVRLLQYAKSRRDFISEMWWYLNRVMKAYTYNSIFIPYDGVAPLENEFEVMMVPVNGAFSALAYAEFDGRQDIPAPIGLVFAGWKVNEEFNDLVFNWHHANEFMANDDTFSRMDRLTKALSMSRDSTGLLTILRGRLISQRDFISVNLPDQSYITPEYKKRLQVVRDFFSQTLVAHRLAPALVYKHNPLAYSTPEFARLIDYSGSPSLVLTYHQLQDVIGNEKFAKMLTDSRHGAGIIHFKMLEKFYLERTKEFKRQDDVVKFAGDGTYLRIEPVPYQYLESDILLDDTRKEIAQREYSAWGVDVDPWVSHSEDFIRELINYLEVDKEHKVFTNEIKFVANQ